MGDSFYSELGKARSLAEVFSAGTFAELPSDWLIALTDVVDSTGAIEAGRYKEVNSAGSLPVMAISNYLGGMDFPFVFGGDGMTCLVPPRAAAAVRDILVGTARAVRRGYGLELRASLIPAADLLARGLGLRVARWEVSPHYTQAVLEGEGFDEAESILKAGDSAYSLKTEGDSGFEPDFSGYTCRWQDFPSPKEETIALLVKFRKKDHGFIRAFLAELGALVGDEAEHHPLRVEDSHAALDTRRLSVEAAIRAGAPRGPRAFAYRQWVRLQIAWVLLVGALGLRLRQGKKELSETKAENVASSDFRKFENAVKTVLSVSTSSRLALEAWLEAARLRGDIFYGLRVSDRATITCLMHTESGGEVHFVDAADGGYAFAAKQIKAQMRAAQA